MPPFNIQDCSVFVASLAHRMELRRWKDELDSIKGKSVEWF